MSLDFSSTGVKLVAKRNIVAKGDIVKIKIKEPAQDKQSYQKAQSLTLSGTVMWVEVDGNACQCGIHFIDLNDSLRTRLEKMQVFLNGH